MKKVKILLTAMTVVAIVGGALAFKATKFTEELYTTNNPSANGGNPTCPLPLEQATFSPSGTAISVTDEQGTPCILTSTQFHL